MFINRYDREYFVSGDGRIRATLDTNQQVYDQRLGQTPNLERPAMLQDTVVLELKFSHEDRAHGTDLLADVPIRIGRHSKFMNAVRAIAMV